MEASVTKGQETSNETPYSAEGTHAHKAAETLLKLVIAAGDVDRPCPAEFNAEAWANAKLYVEYVKKCAFWGNPRSTTHVETRLDLSHIAPRSFGTADCIAYDPDDKTLYVFDYKYGEGVKVWANDNPQLKLYALGALELYPDALRVEMHIIQPRLLHTSHVVTTPHALELWARGCVRPAVVNILLAGGAVPGDHCLFCKAAAMCEAHIAARFDELLTAAKYGVHPEQLSADALSKILEQSKGFAGWLDSLKAYAKQEGNTPPGWQLKPGRKLKRWGAPLPTGTHDEHKFDLGSLIDAGIVTPSNIAHLLPEETLKAWANAGYIVEIASAPVLTKANQTDDDDFI